MTNVYLFTEIIETLVEASTEDEARAILEDPHYEPDYPEGIRGGSLKLLSETDQQQYRPDKDDRDVVYMGRHGIRRKPFNPK